MEDAANTPSGDIVPSPTPPPADEPINPLVSSSSPRPAQEPSEILRAMEVVERDSAAIAESLVCLFSSLRSALSEVSSRSVEHMVCFTEVAGRLQESVLDASTKGNRYINSCLRLNEEMKGIESLAVQLYTSCGCRHIVISTLYVFLTSNLVKTQ